MMKFVAILALFAVAVSAESFTYKLPKFPCAYQMTVETFEKDKSLGKTIVELNGRYMLVHNDGKLSGVARPDILKEGNVSLFTVDSDDCEIEYMSVDEYVGLLDQYLKALFSGVDGKKWDHKKSEEFRGKKCDHYYDDNKNSGNLYVIDDYPYAISGEVDYVAVMEYKWEAPMKDFVLSKKDYPKCYDKEKKVADEPSEDYIMCEASSIKIAFVAIFVALISALF